jgi:hypothetical protein
MLVVLYRRLGTSVGPILKGQAIQELSKKAVRKRRHTATNIRCITLKISTDHQPRVQREVTLDC